MEVGLSCLSAPATGLQVKGARLLDFVGGFSTQLVVWGFEPHLFLETTWSERLSQQTKPPK